MSKSTITYLAPKGSYQKHAQTMPKAMTIFNIIKNSEKTQSHDELKEAIKAEYERRGTPIN